MALSQFGLDFETVFGILFLLLFCISAILWPLSLKGLVDGLIWTFLQKNLKSTLRTVLKAAVQPIWAWFWNGFIDLVPPALLYLYYVIAFVSKRTIWWVNLNISSKKIWKNMLKSEKYAAQSLICCRSANLALILKRFGGPCSSCSSSSPLFYGLCL